MRLFVQQFIVFYCCCFHVASSHPQRTRVSVANTHAFSIFHSHLFASIYFFSPRQIRKNSFKITFNHNWANIIHLKYVHTHLNLKWIKDDRCLKKIHLEFHLQTRTYWLRMNTQMLWMNTLIKIVCIEKLHLASISVISIFNNIWTA